ncbi:polyketide synthase (beta-ketoacyl synthase domain-containing protein) [Colletotrichum truncatum]|uniref:Polyketide synthase (Beta-ketoacyl synthase domain-containing protein) n=1 Tax=Colletotrichum truncatum TaxID=5467 RepID=A0ACC3Z0Y5_COLTU
MEDIAIIGMACRFPGEATSPERLWQMMVDKKSAWSEFPKDRLNINGYYHPSGDRQGSISFRGAHFIQEDVTAFDASFFSVMSEDAKAIDPQQRFLLEVSYEALENAGLRIEDLKGSPTAVYVGSFVKDYEQICLRDMDWQPQYAATGTGNAIMANRISYTYDFKGPSMTVDTGCSGSLVAVHLAAQALRTGDCDLALAAGAGLILTPNTMMPMTALNFLSPDGKCFAFDSRANGYGRGEGVGFVVLKKLSHALRDNDTIRAVIRGTHVNQDGLTTGITLPSKEAQVANIRSLYSKYDLDMQQTAFVECHGTGTQAGDFRELKAISETLGADRKIENPIFVGSLKTNIGHLEGAAGVAGLIKGVLLAEKGKIPPNINYEQGNPNIDFENWKVKVPTDLIDWPVEGLRRISVNCFGFGGTNAHAVLDEPALYFASRGIVGNHNSAIHNSAKQKVPAPEAKLRPQLFVFSANERKGVTRVMRMHGKHIKHLMNLGQNEADNYSYTLACRRSALEWKSFVVAADTSDFITKLEAKDDTSVRAYRSARESNLKISFLFCGQGAQWAQMGKELMCFGTFQASLEAAAKHIKTLGGNFDLIEEIMMDEDKSRISDPRISQPATTAVQVALVDLLRSFNIVPSSVVGHSSGEIAAAYASSSIGFEAACALAYHRGSCAYLLNSIAPYLEGRMCAVRLSFQQAQQYLGHTVRHKDLEIACINSPTSVTISGGSKDILWMRNDLKMRQIPCKILDVDIAYHSRHMKLIEETYKDCIKDIGPVNSPSNVDFFSSVFGTLIPGCRLDSSYWVKNLVSPVQFVESVKGLMASDDRPDLLIDLSPHATLGSAVSEIISEHCSNFQLHYVSLMKRKQDAAVTTLEAIGEIWARGYPVDMFAIISKGNDTGVYKTLVDLPSYPWNHSKSFWHESRTCTEHRFRKFARQDLIGARLPDVTTFEPCWRGFFRISENPWVQDHRVQKTIVYPASGMVTMALQAASQLSQDMLDVIGFEVNNLRIERAMIIPSNNYGLEYSLSLRQVRSKSDFEPEWNLTIYSREENGAWVHHADGSVKIRQATMPSAASMGRYREKYFKVQELCDKPLPPRQLYETLDTVGLNYGPCFQNIAYIATYGNSCISKVRVPDTKSKMPANFEYPHIIHPATLDSMFQTLFAIDKKPMVPSHIESIFVSADISHDIGHEFTGCATAEMIGLREATGSIAMVSDAHDWAYPSVLVEGLHFKALSTPPIENGGFIPNYRNLCSTVVWKENYATSTTGDFSQMLNLMAHKRPSLAVLQCGGNEYLAKHALEALSEGGTPRISRYTLTDKSTHSVLQKWFEKSKVANLLEQRDLSASKDNFPHFDLVIIFKDLDVSPREVSQLLLPEGLLLNEVSKAASNRNVEFSVGNSHSLEYHHSVQASYELRYGDDVGHWIFEQEFDAYFLAGDVRPVPALEFLIIFPDRATPTIHCLVNNIIRFFSDKGFLVSTSTLSDAQPLGKTCISLLEVCDNFVYNWSESQFQEFHNLQNSAKSVIWVTRGANRRTTDPRNAPIIALARTIMSEDPQKIIATLDLDENTSVTSPALPNIILGIAKSILTGCLETEYAEEGGKLYIPRLTPLKELNELIENDSRVQLVQEQIFNSLCPKSSYELVISKPGLSNDNFHFMENSFASQLGQYEVEVRTLSAALYNEDLQTAMGHTAEDTLGLDVFGVISKVGSKVRDLRCGDQVLAIVSGAFKSLHRVDYRLVKSAPPPIDCCQYTPSVFIAAYYALFTIGRLSPVKKILVHAGASAAGQAALRITSFIGAEVFATVLGDNSGAQRKTLQEIHGLADDHILNADSESFVSAILASGKVDIVYNPTQEHITPNFKCVKASGCIVQVASRVGTATHVPVAATAFIQLDIGLLLREDPELIINIFHKVDELVWKYLARYSSLQCKPIRRFPMSDFEGALKQIEKEPYNGLTIMEAKCESSVRVAKEIQIKPLAASVDPEGTYLLAGGLGGLGRSIAKLLADNGVKKLVFLSRSGGTNVAKSFLQSLRGVEVRTISVDITDRQALQTLKLGKISGVVQCAAVIKDAIFEKMAHADWTTAFGPKAVGAFNLVDVFGSGHLSSPPWFLFLSSASGIIGNRSQGNYAAANAVQDALAKSGRITACSLDLGPVLEAGMLVGDEKTLGKLRGAGFYGIRQQDFLKMVEWAITGEIVPGVSTPAQIVSGVGTGGLIHQNNPGDPFWSRTPMYSYMNTVDMVLKVSDDDSKSTAKNDVKEMLAACCGRDEAETIICTGLVQLMAKAMSLLPEEIDPERAPSAYGVDSLVAVSVRN